MRQTLTVPVQVPDDLRVLTAEEYENLAKFSTVGRIWGMKDLREWIGGKSADWIRNNILYNPKYAATIRDWRRHKYLTGGGHGSPIRFKASVITTWLDEHWSELPW